MTPTAILPSLLDDLAADAGIAVRVDLEARRRASADWAKMSPILAPLLPLGLADAVVCPRHAAAIGRIVAHATRRGVFVTPRGKGTGNYGQAIPMRDGIVIDTSDANAIVEIGDGTITAEAGATMAQLEVAAHTVDQQIWLFPSTVNSSIGGFLSGGSAGTGSIAHGTISDGFVVALDVAHADGSAELVHVTDPDEVATYLHAFGTTGVIARATVRTEPRRSWQALYASFDEFRPALELIRVLRSVRPTPRLVSADTPLVVNALPPDAGHPRDRASLRAIVDPASTAEVISIIETAGGRVETIRDGHRATQKLSLLSYNHPTWHLQKSSDETWFHLEVGGDALVDRYREVNGVFEHSQLHVEAGHRGPTGMLNGIYRSPDQVAEGTAALEALGVGVHSPHQWFVDRNVEAIRARAAVTDPDGLLNPGKLP